MSAPLTPSQTIGPFFHEALVWPDGPHVVAEDTPGALWLRGRITDGDGSPVDDALVETWQASPAGRFGDGFRGFGRCPTALDGGYAIRTCKPGRVDAANAPHIVVSIFARGLLHRVVTRAYFGDEEDANASDPVLAVVPDDRRDTLLAHPTDDGYRFDIRLQGDDETVFFAL